MFNARSAYPSVAIAPPDEIVLFPVSQYPTPGRVSIAIWDPSTWSLQTKPTREYKNLKYIHYYVFVCSPL